MKLKAPFKLIPLIGLIFFANQTVFAEPLGGFLPGSVLPEQVSKAVRSEQPTSQPVVPPSITEPEETKSPLTEQAGKIKFELNGIVLVGNRVYSEADLRPIYANKLHKVITVGELFEIVQGITNYYRNNGYIISRAILPPQHVKGGVVKIQIIEGYIGKVIVSGDPRNARDIVQAYGDQIKACRPLDISRMERYLLLANELPGTDVKAVLEPSKNQTGAADLNLVTQNQTFAGFASYDNYGTLYIGPQQMTASLGINSWLATGDVTNFTVTKTPKGGELTYLDLNHTMPITSQGIGWLVGGTRTQTHPLFVLQPLEIDGVTTNYYTTFYFPYLRTRSSSLTFRAGGNYLDSNVRALNTKLYTDHIRSVGLGGTYNFADSWYGVNLLSLDIRQGLPIWGYTPDTNPQTAETSRPGGHANYTKLAGTASRLQAIKGPVSLYGIIQAQWSQVPLLASEQFTFGGPQLGRGYDVAELIGDRGMAGSLELRYDYNVGRALQTLQFYTFYDAGMIWNYLLIGGTPKKLSATSTGLGVRFYFTKYVSGNFMWAQPLTKKVAAEELIGQGENPRVFFSVVASLN